MPDQPLQLADVPVAVLVVRRGRVTDVTPMVMDIVARTADEIVGREVVDLVELGDRAALAAALDMGSGPLRSLTARLSDAGRRPVELVISGGEDRQVVVVHDRLELRRTSAILDAVADSTLLLAPDGRLLWQSEALAQRVPAGEDNLGTHPVERIHPEDLPIILESFAALDRPGSARISHVVRSRAVDDDDVWQRIELIGASRVDDPDLGGVVVQVRNLDEGDELESVGRTDGPLLSLAEAAPVGIVLIDAGGRTVFANGVARELLALSDREHLEVWRDRIAPAHAPALGRLIGGGMAGERSVTSTVSFGVPDGASGWMRMRAVPHRGPAQDVVGVIVALEDVTAEVEARAESERLLQMLDVTSDFVLIFRPDGEILHTNAALQQVLDRLWTEGGSGRLGDLLGAEARDRFVANAMAVVAESDIWQGELAVHVGGGETVPASVLAVVGRDDLGAIDWIAMVARDISALKEVEEQLRHLATLDHLTGLANRVLFTAELDAAVERSSSSGRPVAVLFCDLDRFKEVNDRLGHGSGDAVLSVIADRLREITRDGDLAARVGGDEFVVLCEGLGDAEALAGLAERVIASVHEPIDVGGEMIEVGISIGVALAHSGGVEGDRLLIAADQAMYRAKATGGQRYRITELDPA